MHDPHLTSRAGSCCIRNCAISEAVNSDFGLGAGEWYTFGIGVPGLPRVQTIDRDCDTLGCDIESTCSYMLECFGDATAPLGLTFPVSSQDRGAAEEAYQSGRSIMIGGSGGSLKPPGPLLMHLHTVYMAYSGVPSYHLEPPG